MQTFVRISRFALMGAILCLAIQFAPASRVRAQAPTPAQIECTSPHPFMAGKIAVSVIFPKEAGAQTEWTNDERNQVLTRIKNGLNWWEDRWDSQFAKGQMRFNIVSTPTVTVANPGPTDSNAQILAQVPQAAMDGKQPPTAPAGCDRANDPNFQYNHLLRENGKYDSAFAIIVARDATLPGYSRQVSDRLRESAAPYWQPPYVGVVWLLYEHLWQNPDGVNQLETDVAHEVAHIFGAVDEYRGGVHPPDAKGGYLNVPNSNHIETCRTGCVENSLMRGYDYARRAYRDRRIHPALNDAIGWRDADHNGIPDPLDTDLQVRLEPQTTGNPIKIDIQVTETPYARCSPNPNFPDAVINKITSVIVYLDGKEHAVLLGTSDPPLAVFQKLYEISVSPGRHVLRVVATDSVGRLEYEVIEIQDGKLVTHDTTATALVLDVSNSMNDKWRGGVKIESAKQAASTILEIIEQESGAQGTAHQAAIVAFNDGATVAAKLNADYAGLRAAVAGLRASGNTNIGGGLSAAHQALEQDAGNRKRIIVLLSDGKRTAGLTNAQILAGPAQAAIAQGACIYTIGFGEPNDLDQPFLQQLANASGCGRYFYATSRADLENIYAQIRHRSAGNTIARVTGCVMLGAQSRTWTFNVSFGVSSLSISFWWDGSTLDLLLTDPDGRKVDANYPGAKIETRSNLVHAVIANPKSGAWQAAAFGRDVPPAGEQFQLVASTTTGAGGGDGMVVVVLALAAGLLVAFVAITQRTRRTAAPISAATLRAVDGSARAFALRDRFTLGRDPACDVSLTDVAVSRRHATIRHAQGRWFIQDQGSGNGTYVNGRKISGAVLQDGDRIRIGEREFEFRAR